MYLKYGNIEHVYRNLLSKYGVRSQLVIFMEELSELIQQLSKLYRSIAFGQSFSIEGLLSELVDVDLMRDQLLTYINISYKKDEIDQLYQKVLDEKFNKIVKEGFQDER